MIEVALVFDKDGNTLHWHQPPGASSVSIPDSRDLWDVLWENRSLLGGVAHTHPWRGKAIPSKTDITTFDAIERGLGIRLIWPIVTFTTMTVYRWSEVHEDYKPVKMPLRIDIKQLRNLSGSMLRQHT